MLNKKTVGLVISTVLTFGASTAVSLAGVKVAFTGDQGVGSGAQAVLALVASEGADLLMLQGDLGYEDGSADQWEANINNALGRNFPVLTLVGNHEGDDWQRYEQLINDRVNRVGSISCSGRNAVKAKCQFQNIEVVQVSPGIHEVSGVPAFDDYHGFIRSSFSGSHNNRWRICAWHKNQRNFQTGGKNNSTGYEVYEACLDTGAIIALAHEHAYSRTHLMDDFENLSVVHRNNDMRIAPGNSMMFVSGLGGKSIRPQQRGGDWWGSIYTASQGATHGALFCDFGATRADCYFKAVNGAVPDRFTLRLGGSTGGQQSPPAPENQPAPSSPEPDSGASPVANGYVFARTDKDEYRWIDNDASGNPGNVWIDKACAESAPGSDTVAYPCDGSVGQGGTQQDPLLDNAEGYVYSRTDKSEYRWISSDNNGSVASVWIDKACADRFGGPVAYGDWDDLMARAPEFDAVDSPCIGRGGPSSTAGPNSLAVGGFVFARTDINEYRWIDRHSSGDLGNVWIDEDCARRMGKPAKSGDWFALNDLAPAFDAIASPCQ